MNALEITARALQAGAVASALGLARRRVAYRPVAAFLAIMFAAGWVRWLGRAYVFPHAPRPRVGGWRVAANIDEALFLAWPAGIVALALVVFLRRSPRPAIAGWALTAIGFAASYPWLRQERLERAYAAVTITCVLAAAVMIAVWFRRVIAPAVEHKASLFVVAFTAAPLVGPLAGLPFEQWIVAQSSYAFLYGLLLVLQGGALWSYRRSPSVSSPRSFSGYLH